MAVDLAEGNLEPVAEAVGMELQVLTFGHTQDALGLHANQASGSSFEDEICRLKEGAKC